VYRPRRPRQSPLYRLVEQHIEELLRVYAERVLREFLTGEARVFLGSGLSTAIRQRTET